MAPPQAPAAHRPTADVLTVIALGGAVGALARYGLALALPHGAGAFPWATWVTNVVGCLLVGVLMGAIDVAGRPHRLLRPFLGVGLLGGFTTFSTYTVEVHELLDAGALTTAFAYLAGTVLAALAAVAAGLALTRWATRPRRQTS
ncbi:CrcB family protein [Georgenia halophila]|uniref:fluoride efflux transporter FluC n=1 Tax=Georgenia halophila TaxID=620889 RepID=UPI0031E53957